MIFSSMLFLWIFLPTVLVMILFLDHLPHFTHRQKLRLENRFLLMASLIFYAWGGIYYVLLMLLVILLNYGSALLIRRFPARENPILLFSILFNLMLLGYFKYFNLLIHTAEALLSMEKGALGFQEVVLPIGISFYIFQAMSYTIDVYRGKTQVQKNLADFALYVSLFPQLIAGPIVQYKDISAQLSDRSITPELFSAGVKRFCYGLAKKVLLANTFAGAADEIWKCDLTELSFSVAWLGAVSYMLQIYYDFSGYSDMAIGLGKMFGFTFRENFRYPYLSRSIREFWRRWHISLSHWFREYVYIPLGGSRQGTLKTCRNLFIVFLLTGIWHGANYTFFVWGLFHGFFILCERLFLGKFLEKNRFSFLSRIYTLFVVMVGWIFFRADTLGDALIFIRSLFRFGDASLSVFQFLSMKLLLAFLFGFLLAGPVQSLLEKPYEKVKALSLIRGLDLALQFTLLLLCILQTASGTYNPFIYFQF